MNHTDAREFIPLPFTDADRSEYEYLLKERAGLLMEEGASEREADQRALDEFGCIEFWQYAIQVNEWCDSKAQDRAA